MNRKIVLASRSPRRQELLRRLTQEFTVYPVDVDETVNPKLAPQDAVRELSARKAHAAAQDNPAAVVIAADTIVVCGTIFGKPTDEEDAARMLRALSGRVHQVMTAVSVVQDGAMDTQVSITDVWFRPLCEREIQEYIASGEPMDKAGAYGIQGLGARLVRRIEGDYYGVVGLPVCLLGEMLEAGRSDDM